MCVCVIRRMLLQTYSTVNTLSVFPRCSYIVPTHVYTGPRRLLPSHQQGCLSLPRLIGSREVSVLGQALEVSPTLWAGWDRTPLYLPGTRSVGAEGVGAWLVTGYLRIPSESGGWGGLLFPTAWFTEMTSWFDRFWTRLRNAERDIAYYVRSYI